MRKAEPKGRFRVLCEFASSSSSSFSSDAAAASQSSTSERADPAGAFFVNFLEHRFFLKKCYQQQRPPRDFSIPPPQTPQTPASADSAYLKAIGRMAPLGRTGIRTTLCPDMCTLLPPDIRGMSEVAELLWNALVKPATVHEAYIPTVGRLSALHFCIVGAEGTGKRTALRMACASCCVDMLTISPQWYAPDDLCYAVLYACAERPCIVYFDDIEALMKIPVFKHDFDLHVLGQDELCSTWNQVWLAFGALSESDVRTTPVLPLCGMRIAAVVEMQDREAAEMLVNKFLCVGNVRVEPPLTDAQWGELAMAARGCTPRDLRDFAGAVMYHAMCRISLRNLAEIYGLHVVSESMERQQNGRRQQQQNRAGFFAATDSNIVDSVLGERGDRRPDGCAAAPGTCGEEGIADSHSGHPGDRGRALEISWELDAESIYYHIDADSSPDGIERRTIWRPRGPDDGDFPQGGNRRRRW